MAREDRANHKPKSKFTQGRTSSEEMKKKLSEAVGRGAAFFWS